MLPTAPPFILLNVLCILPQLPGPPLALKSALVGRVSNLLHEVVSVDNVELPVMSWVHCLMASLLYL